MAEYLASHEADYKYVYGDLKDKVESLRSSQHDTSTSNSELAGIEDGIEEAYQILERMSNEVQRVPTSERSQYNTKIRGFRSDIDRLKKDVRGLGDQQSRSQLFGDRDGRASEGEYTDDASSQRQQLLSNQQRLERSSERLRDAQRVGNETEAVGAGILTDLRGQREQIINSRNTLTEADSYVDKSLRTLRSMARRMAANRIISYAIIALLILLIIFVLASKFM